MSETPFQAPTPEYLAGLLPQYDIEGFIAQGGMGAVYKGRQKSLDRDIAIKVLPTEMGEDPEFRESFITEAKAMARLNHPNLLGVFDYGDVAGMPYIVMEYVHGQSLYESAHGQAIEPAQAVAIVKGICDGLAHAHDQGIVHRDIKPSNILLTLKAEPKIGDFGLAHAADSDMPGLVMGTPGYTAPEVFQDPNLAGPLADIYAVGVILHELLTGIDATGRMEPPTKPAGNLRLDAIWRKATHANPAQRYQSIEAMSADLDKWSSTKSLAPAAAGQSASNALKPSALRPSARRSKVNANSGSGGLVFKFIIIAILGVATFVTYDLLQTKKKEVEIASANGKNGKNGSTKHVVIRVPDKGSVRPDISDDPGPVDNGPDEVIDDDPDDGPVVTIPEPPDPKPEKQLPPGDPELRSKAIGLISAAREKRDKELEDNARTLRFEISAAARAAKFDEAAAIRAFEDEIVDNRIPLVSGIDGLDGELAKNFEYALAKEESIDSNYRAAIAQIRDAYVKRLEDAAAEISDEELKQRLLAQAERAADLDAWVRLLSPESASSKNSLHAGGGSFAGNWDIDSYGRITRWIAHPSGLVEVIGAEWEGEWKILEDGTLEVRFPNKKPYKFSREGNGWNGETPFGKPASLARGDW